MKSLTPEEVEKQYKLFVQINTLTLNQLVEESNHRALEEGPVWVKSYQLLAEVRRNHCKKLISAFEDEYGYLTYSENPSDVLTFMQSVKYLCEMSLMSDQIDACLANIKETLPALNPRFSTGVDITNWPLVLRPDKSTRRGFNLG